MFTIQFLFFFPIILLSTHCLVSLFYICEVTEYNYLELLIVILGTLYLIKKIKPFTQKININSALSNIVVLLMVPISVLFTFPAFFLLTDTDTDNYDPSAKQVIGNMRSQANIYYEQNNFSYENMCTDTKIMQLSEHLKAQEPNQSCSGIITRNIVRETVRETENFTCNSTSDSYAIEARLAPPAKKSVFDPSKERYWCADSKNMVIENPTSIGSSTNCLVN